MGCGFFAALHFAMLLTMGQSQVRHLRFVDEDSTTGEIGGTIYWDIPAAGDAGFNYVAYMSTSNNGATKTQLQPEGSGASNLPGGADVSAFPIALNTAIGSNTHILVYMQDAAGALSNEVFICIIDNPDGFVRTIYATTTGYTKANGARTALVSGCHASFESISLEMIATAKWTGSEVEETVFDDANEESATAAFLLTFPSGSAYSAVESAISSYVGDAPLPAVYTGSGASTSYSLGVIQAASALDDFVPNRPDPDIARYIARSSVHFKVAGAVIVTRSGHVRIQTEADKQTGVKQMANVYLNTDAVTFSDLGAASATLTAIAAGSTAAQAQCYQVTGTDSLPSCLSPYTV